MKLVKLECGTWINVEAVKRIQAHDPPIENKDGTILRARVGFLGEYDPWDTEETVEELAEIVLNAVGDPNTILISGHSPASPSDVPPGPPDHSGMVEAIKAVVREEIKVSQAALKAFLPGSPDPPRPQGGTEVG